jgi:hypothetical protein
VGGAFRVVYSYLEAFYDELIRQKLRHSIRSHFSKKLFGIMHIFDSTFYTRVKDGCQHGGYTARFHDLGHWLPIVQHLRVLMGACSRSSSSSFKTLSKIL